MTIAASGYPTSPLSTTQAAPASGTLDAEYTSLEAYDNSEIELYDISAGATPFYSTLTAIGRLRNGGEYNTFGLTEKAETMSNNFPLYTFYEQDEKQEYYTVNGALLSGATTFVLDSTSGIVAGDVFRVVATNEQIRVVSVVSGTNITVTREFGSIAAAAIGDNAVLHFLNNSIAGGVSGIDATGNPAAAKTNVFQKIVTAISSTDFDNLTPKIGGNKADAIARTMKSKAIEQAKKLEKAMLFGRKKVPVGGVGAMGGLIEFAEDGWTDDISGSLTKQALEQALSNPLRYTKDGRAEKYAFCGTEVMSVISDLFYDSQVRTTTIEQINLKVKEIDVNNGTIYLVQHPYMTSESGYGKHMVVADINYIHAVFPTGVGLDNKSFDGKTKFYYLPTSDYASQKGDYVTYATLQVVNSNAHGVFKVVA